MTRGVVYKRKREDLRPRECASAALIFLFHRMVILWILLICLLVSIELHSRVKINILLQAFKVGCDVIFHLLRYVSLP